MWRFGSNEGDYCPLLGSGRPLGSILIRLQQREKLPQEFTPGGSVGCVQPKDRVHGSDSKWVNDRRLSSFRNSGSCLLFRQLGLFSSEKGADTVRNRGFSRVAQASFLRLYYANQHRNRCQSCTISCATTVRLWSDPLPNFGRFLPIYHDRMQKRHTRGSTFKTDLIYSAS